MPRIVPLRLAPLTRATRLLLGAVGLLIAGSTAGAQYTVYGLAAGAGGQVLVRFQSNDPTNVTTLGATGASLVGIDFRPANGVLYGYDGTNLYTINPTTGLATFAFDVGNFAGGSAGVDFNPTVDRLRLTGGGGVNLRVNPLDGSTIIDGSPSYVPGDVNQAEAAIITGVAYTNNDQDPLTPTTLYGIDGPLGSLVRFISPNAGTVSTVGFLGIGLLSSINGFDIVTVGSTNLAFLAAVNGQGTPNPAFYSVDLNTGAATLIGGFGRTGTIQGIAIAAVPEPQTYALVAGGLVLLGGVAARRRRDATA